MKSWRKLVLVALVTFCSMHVARGESRAAAAVAIWYGQNLQKLCAADRQSPDYAMCFSFVSAVLEVLYNNNSIDGLKACIPPLVTAGKAVEVTADWLRAHPKDDITAASLVVTKALAQAFPCKEPQ